ncbi:hypothetical protein JB92DRAFT_3017257 [Gautieria morchelliformis]|nr:hypothetical protein JB92DRAFT_3017257 [Gautieria morchelliformis]
MSTLFIATAMLCTALFDVISGPMAILDASKAKRTLETCGDTSKFQASVYSAADGSSNHVMKALGTLRKRLDKFVLLVDPSTSYCFNVACARVSIHCGYQEKKEIL